MEESNNNSGENSKFYCASRARQYYSAFSVNLAVLCIGTASAWTATAVPDINSNASFGPLTPSEESWVTSIVFLGTTLVCPLSGFFIQKFGLRASMLTLTLPLVGGWFIIIYANGFVMLLIGRFITGFCSGGMSVAVPAFLAETTEIEIRGRLGYGYDMMGSVGELFIFVVGSSVSYKWQAFACACIPIIFQILMMVVPESPRTLISKNKMEEARKSLAWFRHASSVKLTEPEFSTILDEIAAANSEKINFTTRDYFSKPILKPTLICVVLMFFMQTTGSVPVLAYTVDIFNSAGVKDSYLATILVGATQVVVTIPAALIVDHTGRRFLLMFSAIAMSIALTGLGCYMYWQETIVDRWNWVPLGCLITFIAAFSIGFGPIPWVVMGELIPSGAKGFSSAAIVISSRFCAFLITYLFKDIISLIGEHGCYWLFACFCVVSCAYVYIFVPETKGQSLAAIQINFTESPGKLGATP